MRKEQNVDLKKYTTAGVGGPAKFFYKTTSAEKLIGAINWANEQKLPYFILGGGSNVIMADEGFPGLVIQNSIKGVVGFAPIIKVGSGVLLSQLITTAVRQKLSGLQKLAGIPGTVGGAIYGNAGAYGSAISDHLTKVTAFDPVKSKIVSLTKKKCQFSYRHSIFKENHFIILEAQFKLKKLPAQNLTTEVREILKQRQTKNFWQGKCPGSFFQNIPMDKIPSKYLQSIPKEKITFGKIPAGYLLESIGAKGQRTGNVRVSLTHANLLLNLGGGKAADFENLALKLMKKVKAKFDITLEPEIQLINLPPLKID